MFSPTHLFLGSLIFFHFSEFALAFLFNRSTVTWQSWLISKPYIAAMLLAWTEYWIEGRYAPHMKVPQVTNVGLLMVVAGEVLRKAGICTARHHFTHRVQLHRREEHQLVTHGIYSQMRHPGYAGWVLWAIGTQVMLCNPVCTVLFTLASWRFMQQRIEVEDRLLQSFFQEEWANYRLRVPSGIPLIP